MYHCECEHEEHNDKEIQVIVLIKIIGTIQGTLYKYLDFKNKDR